MYENAKLVLTRFDTIGWSEVCFPRFNSSHLYRNCLEGIGKVHLNYLYTGGLFVQKYTSRQNSSKDIFLESCVSVCGIEK